MEVIDSNDEALIKYLLNEQSEEENEELEDRMVLDPELADRAQVVEMKLIDSYVLNQMSPAEKARFEKGFLLFPENHDKVADAQAFHEVLRLRRQASVDVEMPESGKVPTGWFTSVSRIQISALAAALVLITAVVVGVFLFSDRQQQSVSNSNVSNTRPDVVSQPDNSSNNSSSQTNAEGTHTPSTSKPANDTSEIAKLNPNSNYTPVVSFVELRGRVNAFGTRGTNNDSRQIITPHLIKIPLRSKSFTLKVSLLPHEYFKQSLDCSVDLSNAKFQRLFPKGNFLRVTAKPVEGEFPYQVSIEVPTVYLKEGLLYYLRIEETNSLTPFKVKFTK